MLKQLITVLLSASAAFAYAAGDLTFHRGGVTFPMEKISAGRFNPKTASSGKNLILNGDFTGDFVSSKSKTRGWIRGCWLFGTENRKKYFAQASKITRSEIKITDGKPALVLNRPAALEELMGTNAASFYISATQRVPLPDTLGGVYKLSFQYSSRKIGSGSSSQMVLVYYLSETNKNTRSYQVFSFPAQPGWNSNSAELTVPAKTKALNIVFRADGCGMTCIREVRLVKSATAKTPLVLEITPMKMLDNTFVLGSGDPAVMGMRVRNTLPKGLFKNTKLSLEMELPADVEILGVNGQFTGKMSSKDILCNNQKYKKWTLPLSSAVPLTIRNNNQFIGWNIPCIMLRSKGKPGTLRKCTLKIVDKTGVLSNKESFMLRIDPPLPKVMVSKRFLPGFSSVSGDIQYRNFTAARDAFAKFVAEKSGTRWITASMPPDDAKVYRKYGIKYITCETNSIANGYRVGRVPNAQKPAYAIYRDLLGRPVSNGGTYATCPAAIYLKTPFYNDVIVPYIRKAVAGLDGFTPNWEPYSFRNVGCFCDTCKKEFAKFAKIPAGQIDKIWPGELQLGKKYRKTAIKFRGWQHGKLIMTLHEEIVKAGGKEVGMCPEVGTDQIILYPRYTAEQGEYSPYCYADKTKWLNVWGPYIWFIGERPYVYSKAAYLRFWETIRRSVEDYRKSLPRTRAKLLAMPHGNQVSTTALGQPEGMAMDQISAYLAGFDASQLYFFPRGYDHRFWRELGRSSHLIALTEEYVMGGKKVKGIKVEPVTPFPAPVQNISPRMMPDLKSCNILQAVGFAKGGKYLAAVGNFWEKGDVIFKFSFPGLDARKTYSVTEIPFNRQFTKEQGKLFTGKDLKQGILLHAGALRWVFFEIAPCDAPAAVAQMTAAVMAKEKLNLDKANKAAADAEEARDKALMSENDFGEWKTFKSGGLSCKVIDPKDKNFLSVTSGKNSVVINPRGLVISSWLINGVPQTEPNFSMTCFWSPGKNGMQSRNAYRVTEQKMTSQGLRITGVCVTSGRSYPAMVGMKITRILTFSKDLTSLTVETIVSNPTEISVNDVGFRWYFMPSAWNNSNGGHMEIGGEKFKRPHGYSFYKKDIDPASETVIRRIFLVKRPSIPIKGEILSFVAPKSRSMKIKLQPAALFGGVAVWDTPDLFAATCEPFYKPRTIAPGGKISFKAEIKIF